jgi:hypothetical protein
MKYLCNRVHGNNFYHGITAMYDTHRMPSGHLGSRDIDEDKQELKTFFLGFWRQFYHFKFYYMCNSGSVRIEFIIL